MLLLADLTVRVTLVMAATATVAWVLRRSSSGARALVWSAGIVAVLTLPLISAMVPAWEVPLLPAASTSNTLIGQPPPLSPPEGKPRWQTPPWSADTDPQLAGVARGDDRRSVVGRSGERRVTGAASENRGSAFGSPTEGVQAHRVELLLVAWATGAALLLGQLLAGLGRVAWIDRGAHLVTGGPLHERLQHAASRLGIRQRVLLLESDRIAVPVTWHLLRPRVLVPRGIRRWSPDCQTAVLLHELAHVRRRDFAIQLAAHLAVSLYWFNPLVWLARRGLHREREHACDDVVLHVGVRPSTYAVHLVEVARSMRNVPQPSVAVALMRSTRLRQRVQAILDPDAGRTSPNRRTLVSLASIALVLIVPLAALQPVALAPAATPLAEAPAGVANQPAQSAALAVQVPLAEAPVGPPPNSAPALVIAAQQPEPTIEQLIKMRIHGISAEFIEEMSDVFGVGLGVEQLVRLRIHGVSGDFARDLRGSFGADLQMQDLITARIHGVSAEFAGRMSALLGASLDFEQLKKMRIHGVGAELVEEMTDLLGSQPDVDELIKLRIHGVSGAYARDMRAAFGADLGLDELVAGRIHGISPAYAEAMSSALAEDLAFNTLKQMRIHGVSTALVQQLRDAGYNDLTARDLIDIRIHGMERILRKRNGGQQ